MKNKFLSILALITFPILTVGAKAETTPGSATLLIPVTNPIVVDGKVVGNTTLPTGTTVTVTGTVPNGVLINGSTIPVPLSAIAPEELANALATSKQVVLTKDYKGVLKGTSIPIDYVSVYGTVHFSGDRDASGTSTFSHQTGIDAKVFTPDSVSRIERLAITAKPMPVVKHTPGTTVNSTTTKAELGWGLDMNKVLSSNRGEVAPGADRYANTFQHNPVSFTNDFVALQVPTEKQENKYDASSVVAIANALNYLYTKKEGHPIEVSRAFLTWAHDMNRYSDSELASNTIAWNQSEWINPSIDFEGLVDKTPEEVSRDKEAREGYYTKYHIALYKECQANLEKEYQEHPEKGDTLIKGLEEIKRDLDRTKRRLTTGLPTNVVVGDHRTAGVADTLQAFLRFGVCEETLMPHSALEGTNYPSKEALVNASTKRNLVVRCFNALQDNNALADPLRLEISKTAFVSRELAAGRVVIVTAYIPNTPIMSLDNMTKIMKSDNGRLGQGPGTITIKDPVNPTLNGYPYGNARDYPRAWPAGEVEQHASISNRPTITKESNIELATFIIVGMHKNLDFDFLTPFGKEFGNNGVDTMQWVGLGHPELRTEIYSIGFQ
jgi:hypothetical protein